MFPECLSCGVSDGQCLVIQQVLQLASCHSKQESTVCKRYAFKTLLQHLAGLFKNSVGQRGSVR